MSLVSNEVLYKYIVKDENICGGEPVIRGTRISVSLIAELTERLGHSVDEIVFLYPHINHAQVYEALSYYYDNKSEIDKIIEENTEDYWIEKLKDRNWAR